MPLPNRYQLPWSKRPTGIDGGGIGGIAGTGGIIGARTGIIIGTGGTGGIIGAPGVVAIGIGKQAKQIA
jgi:hypothetical protein